MLQEHYADFEILGEESASDNGGYTLTDAPTWIIDPIDGTTNFVHRNPDVRASLPRATRDCALKRTRAHTPIHVHRHTSPCLGSVPVDTERVFVPMCLLLRCVVKHFGLAAFSWGSRPLQVCVSIGLSIKKEPKLGVIYDPIRDEVRYLHRGPERG